MTINKITETKAVNANLDKVRQSESNQARKEESTNIPSQKDLVRISDAGLAKLKTEKIVDTNNSISNLERNKRIEEIREQLRTGKYPVNSQAIADKLIAKAIYNLI